MISASRTSGNRDFNLAPWQVIQTIVEMCLGQPVDNNRQPTPADLPRTAIIFDTLRSSVNPSRGPTIRSRQQIELTQFPMPVSARKSPVRSSQTGLFVTVGRLLSLESAFGLDIHCWSAPWISLTLDPNAFPIVSPAATTEARSKAAIMASSRAYSTAVAADSFLTMKAILGSICFPCRCCLKERPMHRACQLKNTGNWPCLTDLFQKNHRLEQPMMPKNNDGPKKKHPPNLRRV